MQIKDNKIFLLLKVKIPSKKEKTKTQKVLGVDLGMKYAAYLATNNSKEHKPLGDGEFVLWKVRNILEYKKRNAQRNSKFNKNGKGRKQKLKYLDQFKAKNKNFRDTFNHRISKEIIDHAIKWECDKINVEDLQLDNKEGKNSRILRNWAYFDLLDKIKYKCKNHGIKFEKVDPRYTSQKCNICGEMGKREKQEEFICQNPNCVQYDIKINADHNAALNIAKAKK